MPRRPRHAEDLDVPEPRRGEPCAAGSKLGYNTPMTSLELDILARFRALLEQRVRLHALIAYGSRARGDADEESDLDVAVVVDGELDPGVRRIISHCAYDADSGSGIVISPMTFTRAEWDGGPVRASLLVQAILEEGVPA